MVIPTVRELLLAYLAVSDHAVSAVLLVESDGRHSLVYYISHIVARAERRYPLIEKFEYALLIVS